MKRLLTSFCVVVSLLLVPKEIPQAQSLPKSYTIVDVKQQTLKEKQIECLTDNVYHEAKGESFNGKVAVAFVTINRTKSSAFPNTICEVVKQKNDKVCQFSWYCQGVKKVHSYKNILTKQSDSVYNESKKVAEYVYYNYKHINDPTKGAMFYHANYVKPNWKNVKKTAVIGRHIFYVKPKLTNI